MVDPNLEKREQKLRVRVTVACETPPETEA